MTTIFKICLNEQVASLSMIWQRNSNG